MKYVIIGNSIAGIGAIEGIRQLDPDGDITVVGSEKHFVYSRPLISYYLQGKTDEERMKYRNADFYTENRVDLKTGVTAVKIDAEKKSVCLDNAEELSYDKLLAATGSSPFVPDFEGLDEVKNKFTFMTLDDAKAIEKAINKKSKVLIIGAGLIGLKCAEGIKEKVQKITVVDLSERILSSILNEEGAGRVQKFIEDKGVDFRLGRSVKRFKGNEAELSDGEKTAFDILVLALGVRANIKLFTDINAKAEKGVKTDGYMMTSVADVYAAGDCTESYDVAAGCERTLALLPNAYRQGECAGINMAGGEKRFDKAIPMNAIGFFGLHMATAGVYEGELYEEITKDNFKQLYYKDNLLKGYIIIGDVSRAGIYTSLIREQTPLDTLDFELICQTPSLMAFSKEYRKEKLGGAR